MSFIRSLFHYYTQITPLENGGHTVWMDYMQKIPKICTKPLRQWVLWGFFGERWGVDCDRIWDWWYLNDRVCMQYGVSNLLQHIPRNSDKLRERKSMLPKQKSNFPIISTDSGGWGEMGSRCFGLRIADSQKTGLECHIVVTSPSPPPLPPFLPLTLSFFPTY